MIFIDIDKAYRWRAVFLPLILVELWFPIFSSTLQVSRGVSGDSWRIDRIVFLINVCIFKLNCLVEFWNCVFRIKLPDSSGQKIL